VVECQLPKLDVAGSTPVSRSNLFNHLQTIARNDSKLCSVCAPIRIKAPLNH
jgi:hypothetical protein